MNICGIVAEYNPFHNGHMYQINKARESGATHIVAVMSGNYVQRGEAALCGKFVRASLAVRNGVDLVVELPVPYVLSSAEFFAGGAFSVLDSLGCVDSISFGCENDDISLLNNAADLSMSLSNSNELKSLLGEGMTYPAAIQKLSEGSNSYEIFSSPNNILAVEYLKQIKQNDLQFDVIPIKRTGVGHDSSIPSENIASASRIREIIKSGGNYSCYVPYSDKIEYKNNNSSLEDIILYRLRMMTQDEIMHLPDVSEELCGRIFSALRNSASLEELMFSIKTKRYPLARIRRIIYCALIGINRYNVMKKVPYIRVLALNNRGAEILRKSKETAKVPIDTSLARLSEKSAECRILSDIENRATDIFSLITGVKKFGTDLTEKIEITEIDNGF